MEDSELVTGAARTLQGAVVRSIGRAAGTGVFEFAGLTGEDIAVHIQCPFSLLHGGKILIGSGDMRYPQPEAGQDAFDRFKTVYDSRALLLNRILDESKGVVLDVGLETGGRLSIHWQNGFALEIMPDCSGNIESWRVLTRGGRHFVFPESAA